jgi:hypothetical protein
MGNIETNSLLNIQPRQLDNGMILHMDNPIRR